MLLSFFAALAAAIVVMTFVQTLAEYPALPERVPLGFAWNGIPNRFGPRPAIWMLPVVEVLCVAIFAFAGYALANDWPGAHGSLRGMVVFAPCELAILWRAQSLIISAAKSGEKHVPMGGFWLFFLVMMAIGVYAIVFL